MLNIDQELIISHQQASPETSDKETVCYCTHLTDFGGGGPFAEPQPIDFGAALSGFSNIGDNPTVFSVVLSIIGVYFIMLVWARWKDKKDFLKVCECCYIIICSKMILQGTVV